MLQEDIWKESLNQEIKKEDDNFINSIMIKRNFYSPLTIDTLRNYFNIHEVDKISLDSLYHYFGDNIFKDFEGFYLPHLVFKMRYLPESFSKMPKALEEIFKVISPNMGSLCGCNFNYFQYYCLVMNDRYLKSSFAFSKQIYDIGLKNGLNEKYTDSNGFYMNTYFACCAPFQQLDSKDVKSILLPKIKNFNWNIEFFLKCLDDRIITSWPKEDFINDQFKSNVIYQMFKKYSIESLDTIFQSGKMYENGEWKDSIEKQIIEKVKVMIKK